MSLSVFCLLCQAKSPEKFLELFRNTKAEWVDVTVEGDDVIEATAAHPFYVDGKWVNAENLKPDMGLRTPDHTIVKIKSVSTKKLEKLKDTYNFEVEGYHTYFVGKAEVLAHNACKMDGAKKDGTPGNKQAQNKQARDAKRAAGIEEGTDESRKFHDEISGQKYNYHEIVEIAKRIKRGEL